MTDSLKGKLRGERDGAQRDLVEAVDGTVDGAQIGM